MLFLLVAPLPPPSLWCVFLGTFFPGGAGAGAELTAGTLTAGVEEMNLINVPAFLLTYFACIVVSMWLTVAVRSHEASNSVVLTQVIDVACS